MLKLTPLLLLGAAGSILSCAEAAPVVALRRDSAGMEIVENREPAWPQGRGWTVSAEPLLDLGGDSTPAEIFHFVRGIVQRNDGSIVVADGGTSEIRVFDREGSHVATWSRRGGGPGEFEKIEIMTHYRGDSILVVDGGNRRVSIFGDHGFARMFTPSPPSGHYWFRGSLRDGSSIISTVAERIRQPEEGISRITEQLMHVSDTGAYLDSLQVVPGLERYIREDASGNFSMPRPLGLRTHFAVSGNTLLVGSNDKFEIVEQLPDGTPFRLVRRIRPAEPLTEREIEDFQQDAENGLVRDGVDAGLRESIRKANALPIYPRTRPMLQDIRVDPLGNIWVLEFPRIPGVPPLWSVFDSSGRLLGEVETPRSFNVHQVGPDFIAGVWLDENDVEHIRIYSIGRD
jgi:hypothetical protein